MAISAGIVVLWNKLFLEASWEDCVEIVVMMKNGEIHVQGAKSY
jgi:hypothetical protein